MPDTPRQAPATSPTLHEVHRRSGSRLLLPLAACALLQLGLAYTDAQAQQDLNAASQDDRQWVMAPKNYANTRFSGLDQINASNVGQLQVAWTFSVGKDRGQEAAPLIVNNTMYVISPFPNRVFALDATTGDLKWSFTPYQIPAAQGVACCDTVSRGVSYDNGKIFFATLDGNLVALDAETGQEQWHTKLGEINIGE